MKPILCALLLSGLAIGYAQAEEQAATTAAGKTRTPPEFLIRACDAHAAGESVSFTTPRGETATGVCTAKDGVLFAKPDWKRGEGHRHMRAMHEAALKACEGKSAGEAVTLESPRGDTLKATCQLVAVPDHASRAEPAKAE